MGATVIPVIIASDEMHLSDFSGDKTAWPVYMTIGNISKEVRRKPSVRSTVLLGYMPKPKLTCFATKDARRQAKWKFFHHCM